MKYSIITINYNNQKGLRKTIESVINQTYHDFEYIIIDGGSTDGSLEIIKEFSHKIDYWISEPDQGIYNAMNKGIIKARGKYINFMNSGDCFYAEDVLEKFSKLCITDIIVGKVANLNKNGERTSCSISIKNTSMFHFFISTLPHQACFINRALFKGHLYDESLKIVSDWKFFMECIVFRNCQVQLSNMIVAECEYRGASSNTIQLLEEKNRILTNIMPVGIYEDYKKLSLLGLSSFDMLLYISKYPKLRKVIHRFMKIVIFIHRKFI